MKPHRMAQRLKRRIAAFERVKPANGMKYHKPGSVKKSFPAGARG